MWGYRPHKSPQRGQGTAPWPAGPCLPPGRPRPPLRAQQHLWRAGAAAGQQLQLLQPGAWGRGAAAAWPAWAALAPALQRPRAALPLPLGATRPPASPHPAQPLRRWQQRAGSAPGAPGPQGSPGAAPGPAPPPRPRPRPTRPARCSPRAPAAPGSARAAARAACPRTRAAQPPAQRHARPPRAAGAPGRPRAALPQQRQQQQPLPAWQGWAPQTRSPRTQPPCRPRSPRHQQPQRGGLHAPACSVQCYPPPGRYHRRKRHPLVQLLVHCGATVG